MYEYITGRIETLTPASVVVEAAGVGYFLNISLQTFSQIGFPDGGETVYPFCGA